MVEKVSEWGIFNWFFAIFSCGILGFLIWILKQRVEHKRRKYDQENQIYLKQTAKRRIRLNGEMEKLKVMHHFEFENYVADLFKLKGYDVEVTKKTGDGGKDIILRKGDETAIVECKRYNATKVTRPDVQKFHSAIIDMKAKEGFYVTTGVFTEPAIQYVIDKPIYLINGTKLMDFIAEVSEDNLV